MFSVATKFIYQCIIEYDFPFFCSSLDSELHYYKRYTEVEKSKLLSYDREI